MDRNMRLSNEVVTINGHPVKKIYGGFGDNQPCILAKQVAELHGQALKEINRIVNNNLDWFDDKIDIVNLAVSPNCRQQQLDLLINFYTQDALNASKYIYLFSQQGYALLCKLLKSDLAKQIYKQMIRDYFRMKETLEDNTCQITGDLFDLSARRFITALEVAKLAGIKNEHEARRTANRITKQTTGFDLLKFVRPEYVPDSESLQKAQDAGDAQIEDAELRFLNIWWEKYGEEAVDSHYLRQIIIDHDIPLNIGGGSQKSQKIRLSRILAKMKGRQIAYYCVTEVGSYRNTKLWQLKLCRHSEQP